MLTLAIPFHTGADYLRRALVSALQQTNPQWELVVSDDGPEPGVGDLVRSLGDPRLRYERHPAPHGMAANWNRCLDLARTDLVTLVHADDELLPNYVEVMAKAAPQFPTAAALFCEAVVIGPGGQRRFSFPDWMKGRLRPVRGVVRLHGEEGLAALLRGNFIMCPTVCYRRSVLRDRRFDEGGWQFAHDFAFFSRLLLDGETLIGLPATAYAYRRHAGNATTRLTETLRRFEEEAALYDQLAAAAAARGWHRAARRGRHKGIIQGNLLFCIAADVLRGRLAAARQKARFLARLRRTAR
jgi:glycosyltransferase involved in cell wall biosynthesis